MFVDLKPSDEFSKLIEQDISKLGQSPDISLIQEPRLSLGEKSVSSEGQQQQPNLGLGQVRSFPNERRVILEEAEEDILSPEMLKFEKSKSYIDPTRHQQQQSPTHFSNFAPPGLTPNRYSTKTYGTEVFNIYLSRRRKLINVYFLEFHTGNGNPAYQAQAVRKPQP